MVSNIPAYLRAHVKAVIFVVVVAALIIFVMLHSKHSTTAPPAPTTTTIPVTPSTVPSTTQPTTSTTAPSTTTTVPPTTTTTPPVLPTNADITKIVTALGSGNSTTASAVVVNPGSTSQANYSTATLYGQLRLLRISASTPTSTGMNTATETWTLSSTSGAAVTQAKVTLQKVSGTWKVTSWPAFASPGH
jgi:hypothetical protein